MQGSLKNTKKISTASLVKVGILSAIGYILMFISVPIPMLFPGFLKIDISDITALIGGIAIGPWAGILIELLKNVLQFLTGMSTTGGVGELANFLIGSSFVGTVSVIYSRNSDTKKLIIALVMGILAMTIVGCITNYLIILPFYGKIGIPVEEVVKMGAAINPLITDKMTFVIWMIAPFNILKSVMMSLIILPVYKKLEKLLG